MVTVMLKRHSKYIGEEVSLQQKRNPLETADICYRDSECPNSEPPNGDVRELRRVRDDVPWRLWAIAMIGLWKELLLGTCVLSRYEIQQELMLTSYI